MLHVVPTGHCGRPGPQSCVRSWRERPDVSACSVPNHATILVVRVNSAMTHPRLQYHAARSIPDCSTTQLEVSIPSPSSGRPTATPARAAQMIQSSQINILRCMRATSVGHHRLPRRKTARTPRAAYDALLHIPPICITSKSSVLWLPDKSVITMEFSKPPDTGE